MCAHVFSLFSRAPQLFIRLGQTMHHVEDLLRVVETVLDLQDRHPNLTIPASFLDSLDPRLYETVWKDPNAFPACFLLFARTTSRTRQELVSLWMIRLWRLPFNNAPLPKIVQLLEGIMLLSLPKALAVNLDLLATARPLAAADFTSLDVVISLLQACNKARHMPEHWRRFVEIFLERSVRSLVENQQLPLVLTLYSGTVTVSAFLKEMGSEIERASPKEAEDVDLAKRLELASLCAPYGHIPSSLFGQCADRSWQVLDNISPPFLVPVACLLVAASLDHPNLAAWKSSCPVGFLHSLHKMANFSRALPAAFDQTSDRSEQSDMSEARDTTQLESADTPKRFDDSDYVTRTTAELIARLSKAVGGDEHLSVSVVTNDGLLAPVVILVRADGKVLPWPKEESASDASAKRLKKLGAEKCLALLPLHWTHYVRCKLNLKKPTPAVELWMSLLQQTGFTPVQLDIEKWAFDNDLETRTFLSNIGLTA